MVAGEEGTQLFLDVMNGLARRLFDIDLHLFAARFDDWWEAIEDFNPLRSRKANQSLGASETPRTFSRPG